MEKIVDSEIVLHILVITDISGDNQVFKITFETKEKERYILVFDNIWDMKYSVEMANVTRFLNFEGNETRTSSISLIEGSEYIKNLDETFVDVYKLSDLKHYVITDFTDTVLDIITDEKPRLEKIEGRQLPEKAYKKSIRELMANSDISAMELLSRITDSPEFISILEDKIFFGTTNKIYNFVSNVKGAETAQIDFDNLNLSDVKIDRKGTPKETIYGKLPNGDMVNLHIGRSVDAPSLEIYDGTSKASIKIRY